MRPSFISSIGLLPALAAGMLLQGCASSSHPRNFETGYWMPQQSGYAAGRGTCSVQPHVRPAGYDSRDEKKLETLRAAPDRLAPGDRLRIGVVGDPRGMSGVFVIGENGRIDMPGIAPVEAAGLSVEAFEERLARELVRMRLVRPLARVAEVLLIESAGVPVSVSGAVFNEGTVRVGERAADNRIGQREGEASGDANPSRSLSAALRAAGGVRPDADIAHVYLVRGSSWTQVDLDGAADGTRLSDIQLAAGDRVFVPSTGCFNDTLVRPTALTAPGIRVFMSNLSRPAANNASSAIGKEATSLPYGTRFLQGLVSANCVGGSAMNAHRHAVLISRNPMTGRSIVIERAVEELVRSADRDAWDPYLMPGDAIACYDSRAMNFRDVISLLGETAGAATPAILLGDSL